jgi:hypothetical protein
MVVERGKGGNGEEERDRGWRCWWALIEDKVGFIRRVEGAGTGLLFLPVYLMKVEGGTRCRAVGECWGMLGKESWSARGGERFWEKRGTGG